ncbi:30S ribosomal protein S16 [Candidatus Gottesmanbacteria bacterium RIFCSPLOWO2_01_FULL_39_12b]|uniref:Small ribosomal subunit protein bS16 n=1 Tax=Candidatus Gottesmanbacteria bacterium RIFCSPLOWO2_01_FULL_39_12b TaxID=1798388 RepID=A0A1F6ARL7_9BACT|nr:MAG: 30S ribosomal protein S16 [Candidatus Gottesmanbacteria bacterium RIFCSPLOWO2_01_FULL_39_12b]
MSTSIRLKKIGRKGVRFYRVVIMNKSFNRDGKVLESIGFYNPDTQPPQIKIKNDSLQKWLAKGAIISDSVRKIITI